jgi:uncharacterized protein YjbJ (UPF0337 family)
MAFKFEGGTMNWGQIEGNSRLFNDHAEETRGRLTDDDIEVISGKKDKLNGNLQGEYGIAQNKAEA